MAEADSWPTRAGLDLIAVFIVVVVDFLVGEEDFIVVARTCCQPAFVAHDANCVSRYYRYVRPCWTAGTLAKKQEGQRVFDGGGARRDLPGRCHNVQAFRISVTSVSPQKSAVYTVLAASGKQRERLLLHQPTSLGVPQSLTIAGATVSCSMKPTYSTNYSKDPALCPLPIT